MILDYNEEIYDEKEFDYDDKQDFEDVYKENGFDSEADFYRWKEGMYNY